MNSLQFEDYFERGVDYLYCPECDRHIRCVRTELGSWEVECPRCVGECGFCRCHLRDF